MNTVQTGNHGENLACEYLRKKGYKIIRRNFRAASGEIDIIAMLDKRLCFVEVKTRKNDKFGYPSDAVNYRKQKKIINTARAFIMQFFDYDEISFDVCEVYTESGTVNYIENAFC